MKLTVVIPVYNASPYVKRCADALYAQGMAEDDFELIFIDDASSDDSAAQCQAVAQTHSNARVVNMTQNAGAGAVRNRGTAEAKGEFLYFFDVDDLLAPKSFPAMIRQMEQDALDVLFFSAQLRYETPEAKNIYSIRETYFQRLTQPGIISGKEMLVHQIDSGDFCAQSCVQIARTSYVKEHGVVFGEGVVNEDNEFVLRLMLADGRCAMSDSQFYIYIIRENSVSTAVNKGLVRFDSNTHLSEFCRRQAYIALEKEEHDLCRVLCTLDEKFAGIALRASDRISEDMTEAFDADSPPAGAVQHVFYRNLRERQHRIKQQEKRIKEQDKLIKQQEKRIKEQKKRIAQLEHEIDRIHASTTWKTGRALTVLPRATKRLVKRGLPKRSCQEKGTAELA